jgi:hypothetical protein
MSRTVAFLDETTAGATEPRFALELGSPKITVRELIRTRVYEEVQRFRRDTGQPFQGLVQPRKASIDWQEQVEVALEAFANNGVLVLVDDRQVRSLDEEVALREGTTEVTFLRLVPLVGG